MKLRLAAAVALAAAFASFAEDAGGNAVLELLNSRSAGGRTQYVRAARRVAEDARRGLLLQRFLAAVMSDEPSIPAELRLSAKERIDYLEESRPKILEFAEKRGNGLAWYLLYLESGDESQLDRAVECRNVQAMNARGTHLVSGILSSPGDAASDAETMQRAFGLFEDASRQGDANAFNNLGICYQNGYGCEKSEEKALESFRRAAAMGHPEAINNEGRFHREGIGVARDLAAAFACFRKSASLGNEWGILNYALALLRGEGTKADAKRAVELLTYVAKRGRPEAMDVLSDVYGDGADGVEPDAEASVVWMMRARAARGDSAAKHWLKERGDQFRRGK